MMLTPQEVSEHVFDRAIPNVRLSGYSAGQVDKFLSLVAQDYTALYNENAVLKNKLKVLVEKVEEYRSTEDDMRKALMTARRMADDSLQQAEEKKAEILRQAEAEGLKRFQALRRECENEQYRLEAAQKVTAAYVEKVNSLHRQLVDYLENLGKVTPLPAQVDEAVSDIDSSLHRLLSPTPGEPADPKPDSGGASSPDDTRPMDLSSLQLGRDFEIK